MVVSEDLGGHRWQIEKNVAVSIQETAMAFHVETLAARLLEVFPSAREPWKAHLEYWGEDEERGFYNGVSVFAHHIVDSYREGQTEEFEAGFDLIEKMIVDGPTDVRELVIIGLLEDVQNIGSHDDWGYQVYEKWLGPYSKAAWLEVEKMWEGKNSLADVVRAERKDER
ncbi:MAG: hypothetical protein AAF495_17710 [Pseudomonadota bacterium]